MKPKVVVFDVIQTLFDIEPMEEKLGSAGLSPGSLQVWFPRLLRDAFALEVTGQYKTFREIATATLEVLTREHEIDPHRSIIEGIIDGFGDLPAHSDVKSALQTLRDADVRIAALTNGSAQVTKNLFQNARLGDLLERYISIDEVKHWKPSREVYLYAAETLDVDPAQLALVAAHDWDIQGANHAGLITGFVARKGQAFSAVMKKPDVSGGSLEEVVRKLLTLPER